MKGRGSWVEEGRANMMTESVTVLIDELEKER